MKNLKKICALFLVLSMILADGGTVALAEAVFTFPAVLQIIDEEAFYGSTSVDRVVLSENVKEIRARAFAESTLTEINLPDSLTFIAEDAFENSRLAKVTATEGTYAWQWAVEHNYIKVPVLVESITLKAPEIIEFTANADPEKIKIKAKIEPENATNTSLTWSIDSVDIMDFAYDEEDYAMYDIIGDPWPENPNGLFRYFIPIHKGTATITATADDGSGVQGSATVQVVLQETGPFSYPLLNMVTDRFLKAETILEYKPEDGDIRLGWDIFSVRILVQANENHSEIYAYLLDEEPDLNDPTQIDRRKGDILVHKYTSLRYALQDYINDNCLVFKPETLAQAKYLRIMIAGYANDESTEPGWWTNYVWKIIRDEPIITDKLSIESLTTDTETVRVGDTVTWSAQAKNGTEPYKYRFILYKDKTQISQSSYSAANTFTYTFTEAGTYHVVVRASDSEYTVSEDYTGEEFTVEADGNEGETPLSYFTFSENDDGTCTVTGYTGPAESEETLYIPKKNMNGLSVTKIGDKAFENLTGLTGRLIIPDSVTIIGDSAFYNCSNFSGDLSLPDSVISIGNHAFRGCRGFTGNLTLPDSVISIGSSAFNGCSGFSGNLNIPNSVISIGSSAFKDCSSFTGDLIIPDSMKRIEGYSFRGCSGFSGYLIIPNSVTIIRDEAFRDCSGLTGDLIIPDSVTNIGSGAFNGCIGFTGLTISENIQFIQNSSFMGCSGLSGELVIPENVTGIESHAFEGCSGLSGKLVIPGNVTDIESCAFTGCTHIESISVPETTDSVGKDAFSECLLLTDIVFYGAATGFSDDPFSGCSSLSHIYCIKDSDTWNSLVAMGYENLLIDISHPTPQKVENITLDHDTLEMTVGESITLIATVYPDNVDDSSVTWSSSNQEIASVTQNGYITAHSEGEATISAAANDGSDKTAACTVTVTSNSSFYALISTSEDAAVLGDTMTWTAEGVNGTEPYKYRFYLYRNGVRDSSATQAYGTENSYTYSFTESGDYYVVVTVRDNNLMTAEKQSQTVHVPYEPVEIKNISCDMDPVTTGGTVTWSANVTGGETPCEVQFVLKKGDAVLEARNYSESKTFSFVFNEEGSYTLEVTARDSGGMLSEAFVLPVYVTGKPVEITQITCETDYLTDKDIVWTVETNHGKEPLTFDYEVKKDEATVISHTGSTEAVFAYNAEVSGEYTLTVRVTDAAGNTSQMKSEPVFISTRSLEILEITVNDDWVSVGNDIRWTVNAIGGVKPLEYAFIVFEEEEDVDSRNYDTDPTFSYTTENTAAYHAHVYVRDAENNIIESAEDLEPITQAYGLLNIISVEPNGTRVPAYNAVNWKAEVSGGRGAITYSWTVYCDGTEEYSEQNTTGTVSWTLLHSGGNYTAKVIATDEDGVTVQKTSMVVVCDAPSQTSAADFSYDPLPGYECKITGYTGDPDCTAITLPTHWTDGETGDTYTVVEIGEYAFSGNESLVSVVISDSITTMGSSAFANCPNLMYVKGGSNLKNIGLASFENCTSLKGYDFAPATTEMDCSAFLGCTSLTYFEGWNGLTNIGESAFSGNANLTSINLVNTIVRIDRFAFSGCENLSEVKLKDPLQRIDDGAFSDCRSLRSIYLPQSVTSMGSDIFSGCSSLTTVNYPISWQEEDRDGNASSPFTACEKLEMISIPEGVSRIPNNAFANAQSFTSISIPSTLKQIGAGAFSNCSRLTDIDLMSASGNLEIIGENAFTGCALLERISIPEGVKTIPQYAFENCEKLDTVNLLNGLNCIESYAFAGCVVLKEIDLPDSITALGSGVFDGCSTLETANYPIGWQEEDRDGNASSPFTNCRNLTSITVPDGVSIIPNSAFQGAEWLVSIDLPDSLKTIGGSAFNGCRGLKSITIPAGVETIPRSAFADCEKLVTVNLHYGLKHIEADAFYRCISLKEIYLPNSITTLDSNVFDGCSTLETANYPIGWQEEDRDGNASSPFTNCRNLTSITVPDGVSIIPNSAFQGAEWLVSIDLPDSLKTIGGSAFNGCRGLKSITIPAGVETIPWSAFADCEKLVTVNLPDGLKKIENYAFARCISLEGIHLPDTIVALGGDVFSDCRKLVSVNYPIGWQEEERYGLSSPFAGCESLTAIDIPDGVVHIPESSFSFAENLRSINIPNSLRSIGSDSFVGCSPELTLYNVPADSWIIAIADEYGIQTNPNPMNIVYGSLKGRIVDEFGNPVQYVSVMMYPYGETSWSFTAVTDSKGEWSIANIPSNVQYITRFYAEGYEFEENGYVLVPASPYKDTGDIIASLSENSPLRSLSGKVTLASANDPLSSVCVSLTGVSDESEYITKTNAQGEWTIGGLNPEEEYSVEYSLSSYSINALSHSVRPGSYIEAEAVLPSENDSTISFTMKQNGTSVTSIQAGTTVDFTVTAPNAAYIRLVADNVPYEAHEVINGTAEFSRLISSARGGTRMLQMQAYTADDGWLGISKAKALNVTFTDKLDTPILLFGSELMMGADLQVSWNSVSNAQRYTVYVFGPDGIRLYPDIDQYEEAATSSLSFTVPENVFCVSGKYSVQVIASGEGYDSSTGIKDLTVIAPSDEQGLLVRSIEISAEIVEQQSNGTRISRGTAVTGSAKNGPIVYEDGDIIPMKVGETLQLNEIVKPKTAENKEVTWGIDYIHQSVATVDPSGLLTAISPGKARLNVAAKDRYGAVSHYTVFVGYSNLIYDKNNHAFIDDGGTLALNPNMNLDTDNTYTLKLCAKNNWSVTSYDRYWFTLPETSGKGNTFPDFSIKLRNLPTQTPLDSPITISFSNGDTITFNVFMPPVIKNKSGINYSLRYQDLEGTWHPIYNGSSFILEKNLKAWGKINFEIEADSYCRLELSDVTHVDIVALEAQGNPVNKNGKWISKYCCIVKKIPANDDEWRVGFSICTDPTVFGKTIGKFFFRICHPDPMYYFTPVNNNSVAVEGKTIRISSTSNQPATLHAEAASPMNRVEAKIISSSPGNWLAASCEKVDHGNIYGQNTNFDLKLLLRNRPSSGETYTATIRFESSIYSTHYVAADISSVEEYTVIMTGE